MVIVYSRTGATLAYAKILAETRGEPLFELRESKPRGIPACIFDSLLKRETRPASLPEWEALPETEEITFCSPIWAGQTAPAVRYALRHAGLAGRKVNFLYTCLRMDEKTAYDKMVRGLIQAAGGEPGFCMAMAGPVKDQIDEEIARDHMRRFLENETAEAD